MVQWFIFLEIFRRTRKRLLPTPYVFVGWLKNEISGWWLGQYSSPKQSVWANIFLKQPVLLWHVYIVRTVLYTIYNKDISTCYFCHFCDIKQTTEVTDQFSKWVIVWRVWTVTTRTWPYFCHIKIIFGRSGISNDNSNGCRRPTNPTPVRSTRDS